MDGLSWKTLLTWMIWGYHYFWKHPYVESVTIQAAWKVDVCISQLSMLAARSYLVGRILEAHRHEKKMNNQTYLHNIDMLYMAMEFDLLFDVAMEFDQNRSPPKNTCK